MIIAGSFGKLTKKGKLNDRMVLEFVHDQNGEPFYRIHQKPHYHFEHALEIAKEAIPLLFNSKERVRLISNGFLNITTVYE
jgi:hypothetical protein